MPGAPKPNFEAGTCSDACLYMPDNYEACGQAGAFWSDEASLVSYALKTVAGWTAGSSAEVCEGCAALLQEYFSSQIVRQQLLRHGLMRRLPSSTAT